MAPCRTGAPKSVIAQCPICGLCYVDFRAPEQPSWDEVVESLRVETEDRSKWRRKSRGIVLGKMHEHKREAWAQHLDQCEEAAEAGFDAAAGAIWDDVPF